MSQKIFGAFVFAVMFGAPLNTRAADVFLETGLHFGGDTFATVLFTSGDSVDIDAGELISIAAGAVFPMNKQLETQFTLGWKYDGTNAANGDVSFERYPFNALLFYRGANWRIGGGATYHINPRVNGSGVVSGFYADFDDTWGTIAEFGYQFDVFYLGARLTFIEYETISSSFTTRETFNGDSIGIILGARF